MQFAFVALTIIMLALPVHAQVLQRTVQSSAAVNATAGGSRMQGTMAQTVIGRTRSTDRADLGFWYRVPQGVVSIVIPDTEAEVGVDHQIPVLLVNAKGLFRDSIFEADLHLKIAYHRTVLVYQGPHALSYDGDSAVIEFTTTVTDTTTVIDVLPFQTTLGAVEQTVLHIREVEWISRAGITTEKKDGLFILKGLCREGDTTRLIKRANITGIRKITPLPVAEGTTVDITVSEPGTVQLMVADVLGRVVDVLFEGHLAQGEHAFVWDATLLASGQYHVVLIKGPTIASRSVIVQH